RAGRVFGCVAFESGALLFQLHAVLQPGVADHSVGISSDTVVRTFAARLWMDPVRDDYRGCPAGGRFCEASVSTRGRAELDSRWCTRSRPIAVRHQQSHSQWITR